VTNSDRAPFSARIAPRARQLFRISRIKVMPSESSVSHPAPTKSAHPSQTRRTLAIISHPDAGKTTLTEKFLLYGGAIDLAVQT